MKMKKLAVMCDLTSAHQMEDLKWPSPACVD